MTDHEIAAHEDASEWASSAGDDGRSGTYETRYSHVMKTRGYISGGPCICDEIGHELEYGHHMSCGWTLKAHRPERVKALEAAVYQGGEA